MLEKYVDQPVSYLRFSHFYDKLRAEEGTTIRLSLKDEKKYNRKQGDIVWMIHQPRIKFKAEITKIEVKRIIEIPFEVLKADVAPFKIANQLDFLKLLQTFYDFPLTLDMKIYVIWWRRIE